jgi:hypothetical protein
MITCSKNSDVPKWEDRGSSINNYLRYDEIKKAEADMLDIYDVMHGFQDVNYRYYINPTGKLASGINIIRTDNETITWPA